MKKLPFLLMLVIFSFSSCSESDELTNDTDQMSINIDKSNPGPNEPGDELGLRAESRYLGMDENGCYMIETILYQPNELWGGADVILAVGRSTVCPKSIDKSSTKTKSKQFTDRFPLGQLSPFNDLFNDNEYIRKQYYRQLKLILKSKS